MSYFLSFPSSFPSFIQLFLQERDCVLLLHSLLINKQYCSDGKHFFSNTDNMGYCQYSPCNIQYSATLWLDMTQILTKDWLTDCYIVILTCLAPLFVSCCLCPSLNCHLINMVIIYPVKSVSFLTSLSGLYVK